jgi:tRNA (cmo5U34)-methyltransferase
VKSTVEQIRQRFDKAVELFSVLETGQTATVDAPLVLDLISTVAAAVTSGARRLLDVGCGAGNYTLKLLQKLPNLEVTLVDLSEPMLQRAHQRVSAATSGKITLVQQDVRQIELVESSFDIIVAAAVLHHLRGEDEWRSVFAKFYRALSPGGSIWISDMVEHALPPAQSEMRRRYGEYLKELKGENHRDEVFAYIEKEDTPRSLLFQVDLLRQVGFKTVEVLHKNTVFAAFGAVKAGP